MKTRRAARGGSHPLELLALDALRAAEAHDERGDAGRASRRAGAAKPRPSATSATVPSGPPSPNGFSTGRSSKLPWREGDTPTIMATHGRDRQPTRPGASERSGGAPVGNSRGKRTNDPKHRRDPDPAREPCRELAAASASAGELDAPVDMDAEDEKPKRERRRRRGSSRPGCAAAAMPPRAPITPSAIRTTASKAATGTPPPGTLRIAGGARRLGVHDREPEASRRERHGQPTRGPREGGRATRSKAQVA